jgi:hypothetical protein
MSEYQYEELEAQETRQELVGDGGAPPGRVSYLYALRAWSLKVTSARLEREVRL